MPNERVGGGLRAGVRVGWLASATTAGVLVGLGIRHAAASAPFEILGRSLTARQIGVVPDAAATLAGIAAHVFWMMLWGVAFFLIAGRLRGFALLAAALLFVAFLSAVASTILPGALGAAAVAALSTPQTIFLLALLAITLALGTRFARA